MEVIAIIVASILGLVIGAITGLTPGIHNNLVTSLVVSIFSLNISLPLASFVASLAMAHTIFDFIPTVYLGVADDNNLSILPGHELLLQGNGKTAIKLLLQGAFYAILISPFFIILFLFFSSVIQSTLSKVIPIILIFLVTFMIAKEEKPVRALAFFLFAGFLGYATLNLPVKEPLTPLLTGLFGLSGIALSISSKTFLPKQKESEESIDKSDTFRSIIAGIITTPIFSFLPALGSGYAALFGSQLINQSRKSFLILNGFLNVQIMILSFILVYSIGKARTGAAAIIGPILTNKLPLIIIIIAVVFSSISAIVLTRKVSIYSAKLFDKINYRVITIFTFAVVILINIFVTNLLGLFVLLTATALGVSVINSGIRRVNMMACLIVPTILIYLS